ncbi:MAG: type I-C CRISPR-associated protein Cas8c/Csd1 [Lachnospiraceae bacterium]|nr:type I-C CRISPR-associated protein Cas8c/Csd1 [Lachnospiraceae bacterium]
MGWMQALCETFDNCESMVGKKDDSGTVLLPIAHLTMQAQIEITIDINGNFIRAQRVEKELSSTIIPVTEGAASRSSGIDPMPLCDKLCYIAKDYMEAEDAKKDNAKYYEAYMFGLYEWVEDPNAMPQVKAVYQYLKKGTVIKDIKADQAYGNEGDFVRFIVVDRTKLIETSHLWENKDLYRNYTEYYLRQLGDIDIDYITGKSESITQKLPAKIRHSGDKAKLISANDTTGFTFRGRFCNSKEAVSVGYVSSQKAHNALRWLIEKQGYRNGSEAIVCWAIGGEKLPAFLTEDEFFGGAYDEELADTAEVYAEDINQALRGIKQPITPATKIVVMAVDTADGSGQGRLAITYYNEINGSSFLDNLKDWYRTCAWIRYFEKGDDGSYHPVIKTPIPLDIARAAYGTEQNGILKADDKLVKKCVDRILPCIVQKKRFPRDLMLSVVKNAGEPLRYNDSNWERILFTGCALIRRCIMQNKNGKDVKLMELQTGEKNKDRSYCFGRLLAVADQIEERINNREQNDRTTNAKKYWSAYGRKPARTFQVIRNHLEPYLQKMSQNERTYCENILSEIIDTLSENGGFSNEPLKETYLVGYYCQRAELKKSHKKEEEENG